MTLIGGLFITVLSFIMIMSVYGRFFKLYLYTAIAPVPLSTFAGEPSQSVAGALSRAIVRCALRVQSSCLPASSFRCLRHPARRQPRCGCGHDGMGSYIGELVFNMLVLVGAVKMADRVVREMMGL